MFRNIRKNMSGFLLTLGGGCKGCVYVIVGLCIGCTIEKLAAHFTEAASFFKVASKKVTQPADEAKKPENTAEGIVKLCKLVNNAGKVNLSICIRPAKVYITKVKEHKHYCSH